MRNLKDKRYDILRRFIKHECAYCNGDLLGGSDPYEQVIKKLDKLHLTKINIESAVKKMAEGFKKPIWELGCDQIAEVIFDAQIKKRLKK